jgi:hypothetical protein
MQKGTVTKVNRLNIGDRFYKLKDKKKAVYEMVPGEIKRTAFKTYGYWCQADGDRYPKAINGKTEVVYLRHNENAVKPVPPTKNFAAIMRKGTDENLKRA